MGFFLKILAIIEAAAGAIVFVLGGFNFQLLLLVAVGAGFLYYAGSTLDTAYEQLEALKEIKALLANMQPKKTDAPAPVKTEPVAEQKVYPKVITKHEAVEAQEQGGEWVCPVCGAKQPAWRDVCFRCETPFTNEHKCASTKAT